MNETEKIPALVELITQERASKQVSNVHRF